MSEFEPSSQFLIVSHKSNITSQVFMLGCYYLTPTINLWYFREYVLLMDEVYTICEDWGEGSGLQVWETDCNESERGGKNNR